jgi:hypothetical protein
VRCGTKGRLANKTMEPTPSRRSRSGSLAAQRTRGSARLIVKPLASRGDARVDMQNAYDNRLDMGTYGGDVQCQLRLQPHPKDEGREPIVNWISERLMARLRHLGLAYELPLLARLPDIGTIAYPEIQLVSVEDELAFLFHVVSDPALLEAIAPMRRMITMAVHERRGWSLVVETP